jgi:uncharacterized membrane protein (UPF0127 family)
VIRLNSRFRSGETRTRNRSRALVAAITCGLVAFTIAVGCGPQTNRIADADSWRPESDTAVPSLPSATLPDGSKITLELAVTNEEIAQGLMFRPSLPEDRGMLFLFQQDRFPSFWMKNTIIPLDLVFLDRTGRVVDVIEDARPCAADPCPQYIPNAPARAVLELTVGSVQRHALKPDDQLQFERVEGYPLPSAG